MSSWEQWKRWQSEALAQTYIPKKTPSPTMSSWEQWKRAQSEASQMKPQDVEGFFSKYGRRIWELMKQHKAASIVLGAGALGAAAYGSGIFGQDQETMRGYLPVDQQRPGWKTVTAVAAGAGTIAATGYVMWRGVPQSIQDLYKRVANEFKSVRAVYASEGLKAAFNDMWRAMKEGFRDIRAYVSTRMSDFKAYLETKPLYQRVRRIYDQIYDFGVQQY